MTQILTLTAIPSPLIHPSVSIEDRPNSALPKRLNITRDRLLQSIGYLNIDKLIKLLPELVKENTIHIQSDRNHTVSKGEHANMPTTSRSKTTTTTPERFGDCSHVGIGFGPAKAIKEGRYCLFFVDKKTRFKHVFPLKDLTTNLLSAMHKFITNNNNKQRFTEDYPVTSAALMVLHFYL